MSKAEERALERCPKSENVIEEMRNERKRAIFTEGYHQAEKDLELTWEDIPKILSISEQLKISWWFRDKEQQKQIGTQVFWEEVLKRFKDWKKNKNK